MMSTGTRRGGVILYVLALALFFGAVITYVFWSHGTATRTMYADIDGRLLLGASTLPHLLPADFHDHIGNIYQSEDWNNIATFTDFAGNNGFSTVYTATVVDGILRYTASSANRHQLTEGRPHHHFAMVTGNTKPIIEAMAAGEPSFLDYVKNGVRRRAAVFPLHSPLGTPYIAVAEYDLTPVIRELRRGDIAAVTVSFAFLLGIMPVLYISHRIHQGHIGRLAIINRTLREENERRKSAEMELSARKEHLAAINRDLEKRVAAEAERLRRSERLLFEQSKFAAMGQMVGAIAHQWRQPLNALGLYIQDTLDAHKNNELSGDYLEDTTSRAMQLVLHMSSTIDDFRNFFRTGEDLTIMSISVTTEEIIGLMRPQVAAQGITVDFHCTTMDDRVYGYPGELKQVVLNLIDNARHAITERMQTEPDPPGKIDITVERIDGRIVLNVEDNGTGITSEAAHRAFEPYFTTKPEGTGTGIGLYMCRLMIEDHMHGHITITRRTPGAVFTIDLPGIPGDADGGVQGA